MKYNFKVVKQDGHYMADCIEIKGCSASGKTKKELQKDMQEALEWYLIFMPTWPKPKKTKAGWTEVAVGDDFITTLGQNFQKFQQVADGELTYNFKVEHDGEYYFAKCVELKDCISLEKSKKELFEDMKLALHAELLMTKKWPKPKKAAATYTAVPVSRKFLKNPFLVKQSTVENY